MAIVWTKDWTAADDGTLLRAVDLQNIQDDINTSGIADASSIQGFPIAAPTAGDDGKFIQYSHSGGQFIYASVSGLPAGLGPLPWPTAAAPAGWLLCYGQAVSRTTYADLFAVVGTTYGVGDGATTFNLPDMRGRLPLGKDDMGGSSANVVTAAAADTLGGAVGAETHTLASSEMPSHTHTVAASPNGAGGAQTGPQVWTAQDLSSSFTTNSTGSGGAHNNLQPTRTFNYIIKI